MKVYAHFLRAVYMTYLCYYSLPGTMQPVSKFDFVIVLNECIHKPDMSCNVFGHSPIKSLNL